MNYLDNKPTGQNDRNGNPINFNDKLKLPDGTFALLLFDYEQLVAYFGTIKGNYHISRLQGVNNHQSFYLRDCELPPTPPAHRVLPPFL